MKVSLSILKELIDLKENIKELEDVFNNLMMPVENIEGYEDDVIFDIEVTPNRPDLLGHLGVAYQLAAYYGIKTPEIKIEYKTVDENIDDYVNIKIEDERCLRYSGIVVKDVEIRESPNWLKRRLELLGLRPINNAVDISNYVMMVTGHPIHTFDLDLLKNKKIIVRKGKKGEKILCLDEVERELSEDDIVIADTERVVAIAGVIGGEDTGINEKTRNVFIESAYFIPKYVRYTSRRLKVSTDSSYRFERGADIEAIILAAQYAASLFYSMGAKIVSGIKDEKVKNVEKKRIKVRFERVNNVLGTELKESEIRKIINNIGMKIISENDNEIMVEIPSIRRDIEREIDVIEEIAILFGYNKIKERLPLLETGVFNDSGIKKKKEVESILTSYGFNEVVNYSFLSKEESDFSVYERKALKLKNPLSLNFEYLRTSLLPSLLKNTAYNLNREQRGVKIYEWGKIYFLDGNDYKEEENIGILIAGEGEVRWNLKNKDRYDFFELKGVIEDIFENWREKASFKPSERRSFISGISFDIFFKDKKVGTIGEINESLKKFYDIEKRIFYAELYPYVFMENFEKRGYSEISKFPAIWFDLSLLIPNEVTYAEIENYINSLNLGFLEDFYPVDIYKGRGVEEGKRSVTMRFVFRNSDKTLVSEDAENLLSQIKLGLENKFKIKLR